MITGLVEDEQRSRVPLVERCGLLVRRLKAFGKCQCYETVLEC